VEAREGKTTSMTTTATMMKRRAPAQDKGLVNAKATTRRTTCISLFILDTPTALLSCSRRGLGAHDAKGR
jgi:hypothetical protein